MKKNQKQQIFRDKESIFLTAQASQITITSYTNVRHELINYAYSEVKHASKCTSPQNN
jgi:hypothetical protein